MRPKALRTKADWVLLLEAAYAPAKEDGEWGRRLTELGTSIFGDAHLFGMTILEHDAECSSAKPLLALGLPSALADQLAAFEALGPRFVRELFYPPSPVATHVEIGERLPSEGREYMAAFRAAWGCADGVGLCVQPEPGIALTLYAGYDHVVSLTRADRRLLSQYALHLETSYRLRRRPEIVKAVVSADGKLLHREDGALPASLLSAHVTRVERARARRHRKTADAIDLWSALVGGRASLVGRTEGSRRHYLVVDNALASQPLRTLASGEVDVLSFAARGLSAKLIAYALGISEATVSIRLASAAAKVGLATRMELVRIAAMLTRDPRARFADIALTAAERDVLALLAQGLSNREIAAMRSRSVRTIANQVAELLRKTNAPSRRALLTRSP